jgi:3-phosphoshikimate 1-carboxyvinyltransferase
MPDLLIDPSGPLRGSVTIPGDKSITHRALMLSALADGMTTIEGWVPAEVCLATLRCMQAMGAAIEQADDGGSLLVHGLGLHGLKEPADVLHCAGSGTTMRLLAGLVAGQPFTSVLTGTDPLRRRPMGRVAEPLRLMGATVLGRDNGRLPPLTIRGGNLKAVEYRLPVASAQVKSAILLAGLFAEGETVIHEPGPSRDHTERMLRWFGVEVVSDGPTVQLHGGQRMVERNPHHADYGGRWLHIPGDFSSAAFPMVAAAIVPDSGVRLTGTGINPTRTGLYDLLEAMHAELGIIHSGRRNWDAVDDSREPIADIVVRGTELRATEASGDLIVRAIDEFPIFAVAATQARGTTLVREAAELRVKESDRIATVAAELRKMGADIDELPDGMIVTGPTRLRGATVECHRDHRLAMALAVAGLVADGPTRVCAAEAIADSFPSFVEAMQALGADIRWEGEAPRPGGGGDE